MSAHGRLVICPTPIGNLADITLRALETLAQADLIACEDTRHTRILLERHGLGGIELISYHEHNERGRTPRLLERIRDGALVVLVSDAGTPLLSDPGFELVRACIEQGLEVQALPGASAVTTALAAAGLPADRFTFVGFLPRQRGELERLLGAASHTLVAFESPRRVGATLECLAELDPERPVALCRELTKLHEQIVRGSAATLAAHCREHSPRGEIVLVIGALSATRAAHQQQLPVLSALRELVAGRAPPPPHPCATDRCARQRAYEQLTATRERDPGPPRR